MLHQQERHSARGGQAGKKFGHRFQSARRSADADDGKGPARRVWLSVCGQTPWVWRGRDFGRGMIAHQIAYSVYLAANVTRTLVSDKYCALQPAHIYVPHNFYHGVRAPQCLRLDRVNSACDIANLT